MNSRSENKQKRFKHTWDKYERIIKKTLFVLLGMLIIVQILNGNFAISFFPNTIKQLEGESIIETQPLFDKANIEFTVKNNYDNLSSVYILVNGEKRCSFTKNTIQISARNNDIIEVSGTSYLKKLVVIVSHVDDNVLSPSTGKEFIINNNIVNIGKVTLSAN